MINKQFVSSLPDSYSVKIEEAKSLLLSDSWEVVDLGSYAEDRLGNPIIGEDGLPVYVSAKINIKEIYEGMPTEFELSVKLDLLNQYKHKDGCIQAKQSSFRTKIHQYKVIKLTMQRAGLRYLKEIDYETLKRFCDEMLKPNNDLRSQSSSSYKYGIIAHASFVKVLSTLGNMTVNSTLHGLIDYPSIQVVPEECIVLVKDSVSEYVEYNTWLESGTHGTMPLEVAIVILSEALEYFEKPELKRILALVAAVSELSHYKNITETDALRSALNRFIEGLYDRDKNGVFNWATRSRAGMARPIKMRRSNNVSDLAGIYFDLCDEYEVDFQFEKPLESIDDLSLRVRHAFYRVSAALSALTGVRWSELASLKNDAFEFSSTRGKFKSKIKKTNNNSETYRPVTIHAQPIAWISNGLSQQSAIHGDDTVAPWLLKATLPWQKQPVSINGLSWHDTGDNKSMGGFYRELLSELISDYDSEGIPISSHRFRHTWAELAIRRFDGNVPEAIRNYFRHWYGSFMTMDYIREKIKADLPEINRSYMRELVHRIAKNEQEFFGPAARYMLSLVQDIDVLEPTVMV